MTFVWTVAWRLLREGRFQTVLILAGVSIGVAVIVYITAIVNGHKQGQIHELLPWNNLPLERSNRQQ